MEISPSRIFDKQPGTMRLEMAFLTYATPAPRSNLQDGIPQ
jgi:hypothetical protein